MLFLNALTSKHNMPHRVLKTPIFDFCYMKTRLQRFQKPLSTYTNRSGIRWRRHRHCRPRRCCMVLLLLLLLFSAENLLEKSRSEIYVLICFRAAVVAGTRAYKTHGRLTQFRKREREKEWQRYKTWANSRDAFTRNGDSLVINIRTTFTYGNILRKYVTCCLCLCCTILCRAN